VPTNEVNAKTFDISLNPIVLFKIPYNKKHYQIETEQILNILKKHNIEVEYTRFQNIIFDIAKPMLEEEIKEKIINIYKEKYPYMDINNIELTRSGHKNDTLISDNNLHIKDTFLKRDKGSFYIISQQGNRVFFNYEIDATFKALSPSFTLNSKTILHSNNVKSKSFKFKYLRETPLTKLPNYNIQLKKRVYPKKYITLKDIEPVPLVKKNTNIKAILKGVGYSLEFIAKALSNGNLNDIIWIKRDDGKRMKAKVIAKNKVKVI